MTFTATTAGTYYIDAGAWFEGQSGQYTISVEQDEGITQDDQWHLSKLGNLEAIWAEYTGAGVHVGIYDDGVQYTHHDLDGNYDPSRHVVVDGQVLDPLPPSSSDSHGTAVAGLIAAENDGVGTVGVAYGSTITGVNIFSGPADINNNYAGFLQAIDQSENFDVINHSWGHYPVFYSLSGDAELVAEWFEALADGRGGLGTIEMKAAGNDNANCNGEESAASRCTVTVGAYDDTGDASYYSSYGANLLISSPSNGGTEGLATTDLIGADGYDPSDYTDTFGGTSGATPIATGVVALMLEANEGLGWRDVQNILAYSAKSVGSGVGGIQTLDEEHGWFYNGATNWNGGGLHFSEDYGFGAIDAYNAVRMAEVWTLFDPAQTSANEHTYSLVGGSGAIGDAGTTEFSVSALSPTFEIEYVDITIDVTHSNLSDLLIELVSAQGTTVELFNGALGDASYLGTQLSWTFGANAFRGEDATGNWTIRVTDQVAGNTGTVNGSSVKFYGIDEALTASQVNSTYHYTDEYASVAGQGGHASAVTDGDGGIDWVDAAAVSTKSIIDLRNGFNSTIAGVATVFTGMENAVSGDGNDHLIGNNLANKLHGMRGNDAFNGGAGSDTMEGGAGNDSFLGNADGVADTYDGGADIDTIDYSATSAALSINLITKTATSAQIGTDTLISVERVMGGTGNDVIHANFATWLIFGYDGEDTLYGGSGNTRLSGGVGNDKLFGLGGNDTLLGDGDNDFLDGGTGTDQVQGGTGNDTLIGNADGVADTYDGGADIDTIDYSATSAALSINLITKTATSAQIGTDTLISVERVMGGTGNDVIHANFATWLIFGYDGEDTLYG
ncbi:S8 family serine peptidase, partial [Jiella sp. CBK1P-4]